MNILKKYYGILIILLISLIVIIYGIINYNEKHSVNKDFASLDLNGYDKVLIVAHPDDDILWGGAHLLEDNYLVVCITCGVNKVRVNEFVRVMKETNDRYVMLGYPDKTNGERDNWDECRDDIKKDLEEIFSLKDWELVVTHNPLGEYGHQHHKMTSSIVTDLVQEDILYYFGMYYSKKEISKQLNNMTAIDDNLLTKKKKIIGIYKSQDFIQTMFDHMYPYEEWIKAKDWSYEDEEILVEK